MPRPGIVLPVYNAHDHLKGCLDSLDRHSPEAEIIVIDDASTDKRIRPLLRSWVKESKSVRRLIVNRKNKGFVATANRGMRMARTDMVLLNSDTEVTKGWLQKLATCLDSDKSIFNTAPGGTFSS